MMSWVLRCFTLPRGEVSEGNEAVTIVREGRDDCRRMVLDVFLIHFII